MSHRDSEARRSEGVESSITMQSIWPRESGVHCRCAEPYQSWGRVATNAYADRRLYAWPGPSKLHKDACCINFANQPRRPINSPSTASRCYLFGLWAALRSHVGLALFMLTLWLQDQPALGRDAMNHYMIILHHYEVVVYKYRA